MTTTFPYDLTLFEGASAYYTEFRPKYPPELFSRLIESFHLNGQGRLLDLGTGTGMIAIALSPHVGQVVAVDPAPEMLHEAQRQTGLAQVANITWLQQGAEEISPALGEFQLVTIGRAFHWMQRDLVVDRSYALVADGGGLAILDTHEDPWKSTEPWKQAAIAVVQKWLGKQRRAGKHSLWSDPDPSHEDVLSASRFSQPIRYTYEFEQSWTFDRFLGYLYSTAFCLRTLLADDVEPFERELRETLHAIAPTGEFRELITASALVTWK